MQLVQTTDREAVGHLIAMPEYVDVIIPRGGKGLIERISREAKVPVIKHLDGNCHVYVDDPCDIAMAVTVADNAKTQKYSPCNASEGLLVARGVAPDFLPKIGAVFAAKGVEMRCDPEAKAILPSVPGADLKDATEQDWYEEYLAPIISVKVVAGPRRGHRAHQPLLLAPHRRHPHARPRARAALPARGGLGQRDGEREHALRRRFRVRPGRRDRHQHRQVPCPRAGRHRGPHLAQVDRAGQRRSADLNADGAKTEQEDRMVPHLITALTGPINELEQRILESMPAVERWFRLEWMEHTPPFYCSVDIRNAGFKLAPVDTNLYPGGWNNLTPEMLPLAVQAAMAAIEKICPEAKNLLVVPENTRRTFYLSNIAQLQKIFRMAGPERARRLDRPRDQGADHRGPARRRHGHAGAGGAQQAPPGAEELRPLHHPAEQRPLRRPARDPGGPARAVPAAAAARGLVGAAQEPHFQSYEEVAKRFGKMLGIDPWLVNPMFNRCGEVDFFKEEGMDCLRTNVDALLTKIRKKYKEYGINEKPFVIVKADHGTYGMGIMTVRDVKDLDELTAAPKNKTLGKTGQAITDVIIQEGVLTTERINDAVAEPVVYMMDRYVVGGFYRVHAERGIDENLNAPGSTFVPLAFAESTRLPQPGEKPGASAPNRFYMYGVIGRLAMLAASYELEATDPDAESLRLIAPAELLVALQHRPAPGSRGAQ